MNRHWQKYDGQREEYILKLTRTNQSLQEEVTKLKASSDKADHVTKHKDLSGDQTKKNADAVKTEDDADKILLLQEQLNVCIEDFRDEKAASSKTIATLQGRVNAYMEEVKIETNNNAKLRIQINQLQSAGMRDLPSDVDVD